MGAAASVTLIDHMSREYMQEYAGNRFDELKFEALRDENEEVSKDIFLSTVMSGPKKEVYNVYRGYCDPGVGTMSLHRFILLFQVAKLLSKKFNRKAAEVLFHQFWIDLQDVKNIVHL